MMEERKLPENKDGRGVSGTTAGLVLLVAGLLTALGVWTLRGLILGEPTANANPDGKPALFTGWGKPELVLVLSGQQHGYILPCGCSRPQVGGLERRYNFMQTLKEKGWPVVAVDLGDIAQRHGPQNLPNVQGLIKYRYSMDSLKLMGYAAVGLGEYEANLPLELPLAEWFLNHTDPKDPRALAANLRNKETEFPEQVYDYKIAAPEGSPLKVGVISVVGPTVAEAIKDPKVGFDKVPPLLPEAIKKMQADKAAPNPDFQLLLYQGSQEQAKACANAIQDFEVILHLTQEEEPSGKPEIIDHGSGKRTLLIGVGHKGKYVGVLGVYRDPGPGGAFKYRYQLVSMSEDYLTPEKDEKDHPILKLMEQYTQELKKDNYLARYGQTRHPTQVAFPEASYVGSKACKGCHANAYAVWSKVDEEGRGHSVAYKTLENAKRPALRQYDGECVVCHVVGFTYKTGFTDEENTPKLKGVGCESCHGPASEHVAAPRNAKLYPLMNPWKAPPGETPAQKEKRLLMIDQACQKCHDVDNDVHWSFHKKWPKIDHPSPKKNDD